MLSGVRTADDQMEAMTLRGVIHSSDHFREEFSVEIRQ
jgi:hypothetical protein